MIPIYGVLMETLGRRFAMNTACAVFALGTVCCAMSTSMYMLIASRALAGVRLRLLPTSGTMRLTYSSAEGAC